MRALTLLTLCTCLSSLSWAEDVSVGSKADTEGYVLGEYAAQTLEGIPTVHVVRRFGLGGTGILFAALKAGEIDVYPEYTGTIAQTILQSSRVLTIAELQHALAPMGFIISGSLGFNNAYGIAVPTEFARAHGLKTISDLKRVTATARVAFSTEFMTRKDGYLGLNAAYGLNFERSRSLAHSLAYEAVHKGEADVIDVYTTDAKIEKLGLVVLADDLHFFPSYLAVFLARRQFVDRSPEAWAALSALEGRLSERKMMRLNGAVDLEKQNLAAAVATGRGQTLSTARQAGNTVGARILKRTREHLFLVGVALLFSILVGVPLGILAAQREGLGQIILLFSGTVQTIPSLALLCFLIPVFGIGVRPALAALCLYGLLPVVLNTFTGLRGISPQLQDTSRALGLGYWNRLRLIELPLARPSILAGVRTSAIIGVGTATLAALIGAGGYGAPIVAGLAINDMGEILTGAIPSAIMALAVHVIFEAFERITLRRPSR